MLPQDCPNAKYINCKYVWRDSARNMYSVEVHIWSVHYTGAHSLNILSSTLSFTVNNFTIRLSRPSAMCPEIYFFKYSSDDYYFNRPLVLIFV